MSVPRRRAPQRIIDVAMNRALESVRVLDDAARFLLDDAELTASAKAIRHDLRALAESMSTRLAARDVASDVGTGETTEAETSRRSWSDVAEAAGHRLSEALRSIEEWSKLVDVTVALRAKAIRYRGYALHQAIVSRLPGAASQWSVCVLITEALCRRPWVDVVEAAIEGGADCLQLREKSLSDRELLARAHRLVEIAAGRAAVVVNDRVDIALLAGADGVHVGADDLDVAAARRLAGRQLVVGVSTHTLDEADAAVAAGADLIGIGTIYPSATKVRDAAGAELLRGVLARHPEIAHLAIGGIDPGNAPALRAIGCRGIAVSGSVCGSDDPGRVVSELVEIMRAPGAA